MLKIDSPTEITVTSKFKEKLDDFVSFLENCCVIRSEVKTESSIICQDYRRYLREKDLPDVSSNYINFMLSVLGFDGRYVYGIRPVSSYRIGEHRYLTPRELNDRNGEDVMIKHVNI